MSAREGHDKTSSTNAPCWGCGHNLRPHLARTSIWESCFPPQFMPIVESSEQRLSATEEEEFEQLNVQWEDSLPLLVSRGNNLRELTGLHKDSATSGVPSLFELGAQSTAAKRMRSSYVIAGSIGSAHRAQHDRRQPKSSKRRSPSRDHLRPVIRPPQRE